MDQLAALQCSHMIESYTVIENLFFDLGKAHNMTNIKVNSPNKNGI
jgi:hypothetical protein